MPCKTCLYSQPGPINPETLQKQLMCYYYPPKVYPIVQGAKMGTMNARPIVLETDFCRWETPEEPKDNKNLRF